MKIKKLVLNNFMAFENAEINWSDNINIICGENSTGKTTLLKVMYSLIKPFSNGSSDNLTKEMAEQLLVKKIQGIFRPDEMKIGRLVSRKQGSNRTEFSVELEKKQKITVGFGNRQENHADVFIEQDGKMEKYEVIYIPTKEMISTVEHFVSLYDEYHIDFEEMYYDLAKLLDRPLSKGPNTTEQNQVLNNLEDIMKGQIIQKNKKFYFKIKGEGEFEMGLLSDGYRKLSMIIYMILSGSINKNTILFWDEPETNMNPKMIRPIVQAMIALAQMGVQIFVSTHDYFIQQEFNMIAVYPELNPKKMDIRFVSLFRDEKTRDIQYEMRNSASDLEHNAIMQEFDAMYDREQRIIYGD
ncbi:ATP-binding protein [Lachnoclostridium sp. An169]|uniref:AAA family ATPase n=1 Tax=Lachnoclostridium sp. An169 TaxID=1965569 RepID=UPI000B375E42|nr:ATP-binding protein [Lachnoclostridium sp. An169]OUP85101.1 ATP-binding protein [Lachnoclostridium sp. An169]HJA67214.1 AAA family ATPase [Candidatus Mediterraneibacter cottocaccae]